MKKYTPHLGEASLLDACAQPGCPICVISQNSVNLSLMMVLHDYVDAPDLREAVCASWGYCRAHAWGLSALERGNILTVAIMYQDILSRDAKTALNRAQPNASGGALRRMFKGKPSDASRSISVQPPCPACLLGEEVETNALKILLTAFGKQDARMENALRQSDGLCFPHLRRALELGGRADVQEKLLSLAREKLDAITQELNEFVRKHDYRFQHEETGDEKYSWQRAINLIVGANAPDAANRNHEKY